MRWIVALALTTGCSLVYDFGVFDGENRIDGDGGGRDGEVDGDAGPPPADADISMLAIASIEPEAVAEGAGCAYIDGACAPGSRGAVVVLHGANISPIATVTLTGYHFTEPTAVASQVSRNGDMLAFAVPIDVDPALGAGANATIAVTVTQAEFAQSIDLAVAGLAEFAPSGQVDVGSIASLYSTIDISTPIDLVGDGPARFVATASIEVDAMINARGGAVRRAGGCLGGLSQSPGNCAPRGGGAGGVASGGGGGGNAAVGSVGAGATPGGSGAASPASMLTPLIDVAGHGGGGGGPNAIALGGQPGGGGGGVVELTSGGSLAIGAGGAVDVHGAAGTNSGGCLANLGGGAGGGGSGGAILLRARSLSIAGGGTVLAIAAGSGGTGTGGCGGGAGSIGQLRFDAAVIADPQNEIGASAVRGAIWPGDAPTIMRGTGPVDLPLVGAPGVPYHIKVNTDPPEPIELGAESDLVEAQLERGLNRVCALVVPDGSVARPESQNCIDIAFLP